MSSDDSLRTNLTPGATNNKTQLNSFINDSDKFMSNARAWDGIRVSSPYTPTANVSTLSFTLSNVNPYGTVVTKVPYSTTYGVRTRLNGLYIDNTVANTSGNVSFTISNVLHTGDLLEYTVYTHVINQRQSLSKALRASADNI